MRGQPFLCFLSYKQTVHTVIRPRSQPSPLALINVGDDAWGVGVKPSSRQACLLLFIYMHSIYAYQL